MAHAAAVGIHAICCGMPVLAMAVTALWGTASAAAAAGVWFLPVHEALHGFELWIVAASAMLVSLGGLLEWITRRGAQGSKGIPWLFALSLGAFVVNVAVVFSHQG